MLRRSQAGLIDIPRVRAATRADLPRIHAVRHGTMENPLADPTLVTDAEVVWYMDEAIFLVSEDEEGVQGFVCANYQTGYVWALFVIEAAQGRGHGTALLDAALTHLIEVGHRQTFLATDPNMRAAWFYKAKSWHSMGTNLEGEEVFVRAIQRCRHRTARSQTSLTRQRCYGSWLQTNIFRSNRSVGV